MLPKLITNAQQYVSRDTKGLTIAEENLILCQPARGVEPRAFSLRMKCSTTELYGQLWKYPSCPTTFLHTIIEVVQD